MPYGRRPVAPTEQSPFDRNQRLDAPYGGPAADGFGGYGRRNDGYGSVASHERRASDEPQRLGRGEDPAAVAGQPRDIVMTGIDLIDVGNQCDATGNQDENACFLDQNQRQRAYTLQ